MGVCLIAGGAAVRFALAAFTLSWTHSVEKVRWEESWRLADGRLQLVEARVQGSGAGMEPPEGAVLEGGWWTYRPDLPPQSRLLLASSGATIGGWTLCGEDACREIGNTPSPDPVTIKPCG